MEILFSHNNSKTMVSIRIPTYMLSLTLEILTRHQVISRVCKQPLLQVNLAMTIEKLGDKLG